MEKRLNFRTIYSQIVKYGRTIPDVATENGLDEESLIARMRLGLDPKALSKVFKANERNLKKVTEVVERESVKGAAAMKKRAKATKNVTVRSEVKVTISDCLENLESQRRSIEETISKQEKSLSEAGQILEIHEESLKETQKVFDEAKRLLAEAKKKRDEAKHIVEYGTKHLEELKRALENLAKQITEVRNKTVYLVAPGFSGKKPEYGTFYSTEQVEGYEELHIQEPSEEYAIEPDLKDMVIAGYDSYKEYMAGLRFIMLCAEFTFKDVEYTILVDNAMIEKLLKVHIGS